MKLAKILLSAFILATSFTITGLADETTFVDGTKIGGVSVSGMTVEQASDIISGFYEGTYMLTIKEKDGKTETINGKDIGYKVGSLKGLQEILDGQNETGRKSGPAVDNSHEISLTAQYSEDKLNAVIDGLSCVTEMKQTQNASISAYQEGKPFEIIPEVNGTSFDKEKFEQALKKALDSGEKTLDLQALGIYDTVTVTKDSPELIALCDSMNRVKDMTITYKIGTNAEVLPGTELITWLEGSQEGKISVNRDKAAAYVAALAGKYNTVGGMQTFHSASGKDVSIQTPYGYEINQPAETDALISMVQTAQSQEREPEWKQKGNQYAMPQWGQTFVEVDLTSQHVYYYKDGVCVWNAPCVTGNVSKKYDTPAGVYSLYAKQKNRVLRGPKQADGTYEYESPVSYWMPFNGGIGLHDANWRGSFGGTIYKTNGSHGCVNLPPSTAGQLYDMLVVGTPVICHF